jgi:hypothetical protein
MVGNGLISGWYGTATERVPEVSGTDASFVVHYALTLQVSYMIQATASALKATEKSLGVVN